MSAGPCWDRRRPACLLLALPIGRAWDRLGPGGSGRGACASWKACATNASGFRVTGQGRRHWSAAPQRRQDSGAIAEKLYMKTLMPGAETAPGSSALIGFGPEICRDFGRATSRGAARDGWTGRVRLLHHRRRQHAALPWAAGHRAAAADAAGGAAVEARRDARGARDRVRAGQQPVPRDGAPDGLSAPGELPARPLPHVRVRSGRGGAAHAAGEAGHHVPRHAGGAGALPAARGPRHGQAGGAPAGAGARLPPPDAGERGLPHGAGRVDRPAIW